MKQSCFALNEIALRKMQLLVNSALRVFIAQSRMKYANRVHRRIERCFVCLAVNNLRCINNEFSLAGCHMLFAVLCFLMSRRSYANTHGAALIGRVHSIQPFNNAGVPRFVATLDCLLLIYFPASPNQTLLARNYAVRNIFSVHF
jgi:hypothetical protein